MKFLQTLGPIITRPAPLFSWHEIDYSHAQEARSTRATVEAVNSLFDQIARENLNVALERGAVRT